MSRKGQILKRLVSIKVEKEATKQLVTPRTSNALLRAIHQGNVSSGGPPKPTVSPFLHMKAVRGYPCASSLGLPPPDKIVLNYNAANTDDFIALADKIELERPDLVVEGNEAEVAQGTFVVTTEDGDVLEEGSLDTITAERVLELVELPSSDSGKQAVAGQDCVI